MSERALALDLPGASLPTTGDPVITNVIAGAFSLIDLASPGASAQAGGTLGIKVGADQVILILVDGLEYKLVQDHLGHAPTLRHTRDDICSIHTVVPSTTIAAVTAFGTGTHPSTTNMVGLSVTCGGGIMNLLAMGGRPAPARWQPTPTYFERLAVAGVSSVVISPTHFAGSGLTGAALQGAHCVPAESLSDRVSTALRELCAGTPVVYLRWSEIDHARHSSGVGSDVWIGYLEELDTGLSALLCGLPTGVQAVMTTDHGMINVEHSAFVDVTATPALREDARIVTDEARAVHVHAQEGRVASVETHQRDVLGKSMWVLSQGQMGALAGPGDGALIIGDLLVLTRRNDGIVDSRIQSASAVTTPDVHGSLTPAEMRIPVIVPL